MSDVIISVENLGKKYRIAHQAERQRYVALRDVIAEKARRLFSRGQKSEVRSQTQISDLRSPTSGKSSEDFWALKDVSFEVKRGEVVGIIGRNGAGKSTLLKILSRITEPTTGRVHLRGRVASLLEVGTGFHPELTGRENIYLNGAILGMSRAEIRKKFDEIVAFAEVDKFLDTPVKRYSSGMYVRLAFAVAAHLEPEILIVDEVLAVGDAEFQKKCLGKMQEVSTGGRTVLFVSHNLDAVTKLCPTAIMIQSGKIAFSGATQAVIAEYICRAHSNLPLKSLPQGTKGLCLTLKYPTTEALLTSGEPAQMSLICEAALECQLLELAIIIENDRGQRVGLLDLRLTGNSIVIRSNTKEVFTVQINNLELVPGRYSVKVWASGEGIQKDIELGDFEVLENSKPNTLSLYQNEINGIVKFRGTIKRQTATV